MVTEIKGFENLSLLSKILARELTQGSTPRHSRHSISLRTEQIRLFLWPLRHLRCIIMVQDIKARMLCHFDRFIDVIAPVPARLKGLAIASWANAESGRGVVQYLCTFTWSLSLIPTLRIDVSR